MDSHFVQQLKSTINIVDVVQEKVPLKRAGAAGNYKGLCPFHNEKTPSFNVNPKLQIYICFGCSAKGDVINFVMETEHITFWEACKSLAERYGIPLPKRSEHADAEARQREAIYQMNELALKQFRAHLLSPQGAEARQYLASRGVTGEIAEEFGIGLADRAGNSLTSRLAQQGFSTELLEHSGLVLKRQEGGGFFDRFRGRLMFTIHNESGKIVGFAGRALNKGEEPKYLNSPETVAYKKSRLLYNMHRAKEAGRSAGRFVLVEGYMDVIGLWAGGIHEVVASCGTALTQDQVRIMKRHTELVTVNFDPDEAGANAAERSIKILVDEKARVKILELDRDLDPDEYIKQFGAEMYRDRLQKAPPYYIWLADRAKRRFDSSSAEGRTAFWNYLLPELRRIPDRIEQAGIAGDLASYLGVDKNLVLGQLRRASVDNRERPAAQVSTPAVPAAEQILLQTIVHHPELRGEIIGPLGGLANLDQLRLAGIFRVVVDLHELEPEFDYHALEARLAENDRALLPRLFFADEGHESDNLEAVRANAGSCLRALENSGRDARLADLRRRVKEEQQKGNLGGAMRLMEELDQLRRTSPGDGRV